MKPEIFGQGTGLVIMDGSSNLVRVYEKYLRDAGFRVVKSLTNAKDAISFFASDASVIMARRELGEVSSVSSITVLLDYQLLQEEGVEDAARKLKELNSRVRIILTAKMDCVRSEFDETILDAIILKPFTISELLEVIWKLKSFARVRSTATLVSGIEKVMQFRISLIGNARKSVIVYSSLSGSSKSLCPELRQAWKEAVEKGIQTREITEVTKDNIAICKDFIEIGIDLRHLNNVSGVFAINEKELLVKLASDEEMMDKLQYFYSDFPLIVEQHRSIFNNLWMTTIPASVKIRELEEK